MHHRSRALPLGLLVALLCVICSPAWAVDMVFSWETGRGVPWIERYTPYPLGAEYNILHCNYAVQIRNPGPNDVGKTNVTVTRYYAYTDANFQPVGTTSMSLCYNTVYLEHQGGDLLAPVTPTVLWILGGSPFYSGSQWYALHDEEASHQNAPPGAVRCCTTYTIHVEVAYLGVYSGWQWQVLLNEDWDAVVPVGAPGSW